VQLVTCDQLIPPRTWRAALADWPAAEWMGWHVYDSGKRASRCVCCAPLSVTRALQYLAGCAPLLNDDSFPDLSFYGAGLHELPAGDGLPWHHDAERHPLRPWRRAQTAILYLDNGGDLVFGNGQRVTPQAGRVVVFSGDALEHCVEPSQCVRRSLTVFFYVIDAENRGRTQAIFRSNLAVQRAEEQCPPTN